MQRVVVGFDTGFAAYPLLDPTIVGDTSGNGAFSSLDILWLQRRVVGFVQPVIPDLPTLAPSPAVSAATSGAAEPSVSVESVTEVAGGTEPVSVSEPDTVVVAEPENIAAATSRVAQPAPEPVSQPPQQAQELAPDQSVSIAAASVPVVDVLADPPAAVQAAVQAPLLDWTTRPGSVGGERLAGKAAGPDRTGGERRDWVSNFVNRVGRTDVPNPNDSLRLTIAASAKTAPSLELLDRP